MRKAKKFVPVLLFLFVFGLVFVSPLKSTGAFVQANSGISFSVTTNPVQFASNDTAGNMIWVVCTYATTHGGICNSVPTDTESNAYVADGSAVSSSDNFAGMIAYHAFNIHGGTQNTVTCNNDGANENVCIIGEFSGLNAIDKQASGGGTTGTSITSANTATTTHATETLLGGGGVNPLSGSYGFSAPGSGFTSAGTGNCNSTLFYACMEYQNVTSTGAYAGTATLNNAGGAWVMWISTYYQSAGGHVANQFTRVY